MTDTAQATATITQAMIDAGANALAGSHMGSNFTDDEIAEIATDAAKAVIEAALAAAPPPAPSDLEQAFRTDPCHYCGGSGYVTIYTHPTRPNAPSRKKCLVCKGDGVLASQHKSGA